MSSGSKPWRQGSNACGVSADASPRTPKSRMYGRSGQTAGTSPSTAAVSVTSSRSAPPNSSSRISYCSNDRFAGDPSLSCPASSRSSTSIKSGAPSRRAQQRYMDERSTDMDRGMNSARNNPFYALVFHRRKQQQQQQQRADEPIRTLESTCAHFAGSSSSKADASSDDDDRRLYAREKTKEGISDGLDLSSSERHRDVVTPQLVVHASLPTVVPSLTGGDPSDPAPSCEEECVLYSTSRRSSVSESVARFNAAVAGHDRGGRSVMDGEVDKELISIINPETHEPHLGKQARGAACVTSSAPRPRSADSQMGVSHVVRPSSASGSSPRLSDEARPESARMRRVSPSLSSGVDEWGPRAPSALCVSSTSSLGGIRASGFGAQNVHEWPRMTPIEGELTDRVLRTPPYASTASRELVSVSPTTSNSSCGVLSSSSRPMSVATPARSSPCLSVSTNTTVLDQTGGANSSSPHPRGLSARQTPLSSISSTPVGQSADRGGRGLYSVCRSEESSASPWRGTRGGEDWVKEECSPLPVAPREEKTASALSLTSVPSVPPLPLSVVTFAPPYDPDFVSVEGRSVTSSTPPRSVRKWSVPPVPVMRRPPVAPKNHRSVSRALQKHRINPSARRLLAEYVGRTQQASRMTKAWIDDAQEGLPPGSWRPHRYHDRGWATKKRAASGAGISEEPTADDDLWMTLNSSAMDSFLISHGADGDEKFVFLNGESSHGSRSPSQGCSPRSARREKSERRTDGRSPPWRRGDGTTISAVEVRSVHTRRLASVSRRTSRQRRGSSTEGTPEHQLLDEWNMAERFAALDRARAENSEVLEETAAARRARRRNRRTSMDLSSTAEDWETLILEEHDELNPSRLLAPDLQSERPVTHPCSSPTRRTSQPTQRMDEITDEHHLSLEVEQPCEAFSALQMGGVGLEERVTDFVSMASADNSAGDALTSPVSMDGADDFTSHGETLPCCSPPTSMPNNDITPPITDFAIPADESPTCVTPINHLSAFTSPQPSARSTGDQLTTPSRSPRLRLSRTPRGTYQPNGLGRSYHVIVHTHEPRQRSQPATESGEVGEACDPPHRVMPSLRGWLERHDEARSDYGRNAASSLSPGSHLTTWRSSGADSSATPPRRGNRRRLVTVSDGKVLKLCMEGSNESSRQRVENSLSPSISEYMPSGRGSRPSPGPMTALLDKSSSSLLGTATGGSSGRHGSQPGTPPPPPARTYTSSTSDVTFVHSQTAPAVQSTETPERLAAASTLHNPLSLLLRRSNTSLKTAATSVAVPPPPPSSRSAKQQRMLSVPSFLPDSSRESNLRRSQRGMPLNSAAQLVLEDGFKSSGGPARSSWGRSLLSPPSAGAADLPRQHVVTRSGRRGETSAAPRPRSEEVDRTGDPLMPDTSNDVRFCRT